MPYGQWSSFMGCLPITSEMLHPPILRHGHALGELALSKHSGWKHVLVTWSSRLECQRESWRTSQYQGKLLKLIPSAFRILRLFCPMIFKSHGGWCRTKSHQGFKWLWPLHIAVIVHGLAARDQELGATPQLKKMSLGTAQNSTGENNSTDVSKSAARVGDQQDIIAQSIRAWHRPWHLPPNHSNVDTLNKSYRQIHQW